MDSPSLNRSEHERALAGLRRINGWSAPDREIWPPIRELCLARQCAGDDRPVRVLDLAMGGGDCLVRLDRRARRERLPVHFAGCDRSPQAVGHAARLARRAEANIEVFQADLLKGPIPQGYDVLTCSLFLHHLDEAAAVSFLHDVYQAAGKLVLIDDLIRCRAGWLLAAVGVRLLSMSRIVHVDGPRSVEGAFTVAEARALALRAAWRDVAIQQHWPFRFLMLGRPSR